MPDTPVKIFFIDDLPEMIEITGDIYRKEGLTVLGTTNIDEVMDIFKRENPQIVVLEPFIFGGSIELLKQMKQLNPNVIRIIYTICHPPGYEEPCFQEGYRDYYFHKPLEDEEGKKMRETIIGLAERLKTQG